VSGLDLDDVFQGAEATAEENDSHEVKQRDDAECCGEKVVFTAYHTKGSEIKVTIAVPLL
jgi:hypothetical protein